MGERERTTLYPHAARAYASHVLAALWVEELDALERFAARALDDPRARPRGAQETAVLRRVDALIGSAHLPARHVPRGVRAR